jgi:primosomal protein N' (replication factor Y)
MPELIGGTVEVAIAMAVPGTYTYSVPEALRPAVAPGVRVLVSFGRRRVTGYLLGPGAPAGQIDIKPVLKVRFSPRPCCPCSAGRRITTSIRWAR